MGRKFVDAYCDSWLQAVYWLQGRHKLYSPRLVFLTNISYFLLFTIFRQNDEVSWSEKNYERRNGDWHKKYNFFEDWFRCLLVLFCLKNSPFTECCLVAGTVNVNRDSCVSWATAKSRPTDRLAKQSAEIIKASFIRRIESRFGVSKNRWLLFYFCLCILFVMKTKTCIVRHHDEGEKKKK